MNDNSVDNSNGLFDQLGGTDALVAMVKTTYDRVLSDPELSGFFEHVDMDRLHNMQFQFLATAFDGPHNYTGAELTKVHAGRGIKAAHFAKFCGHFADVLEERQVPSAIIDQALARLAMFKDKITGDTNVDG